MASSAGRLARLTINGQEYNVIQFTFESIKPVDKWNRVTAFAIKADARFVLEGTGETTTLFESYANSRRRFNAKLTLYKPHDEGVLTEVNFDDCSITYYASNFNTFDEFPFKITIVINPKLIKEGSGELSFDQNT